jgi:two-component system NarL family sensor kinase
VIQEACSNVARHSGAAWVRASLRQDAAAIVLCVADNGRGIDGSMQGGRANPGMGMRSMRDRIESTGGTFSVESHAGAGTCVSARWPRAGAAILT